MPESSDRATSETQVRTFDEGPAAVHLSKPTCQLDVEEELKTIAKTAFFTAVVHPFNYAQVLMQIGYEPLPARIGKDFFGKQVYYLASVFDYLQHIRKQVGFSGLFLGLKPTLLAAIGGVYAYRGADRLVTYVYDERYLGRPTHTKIKRFGFLELHNPTDNLGFAALRSEPRERIGITYTNATFAEDLAKEIAILSISLGTTWPLQVIAFRTMAQFVGGENIYDGLLTSVREILDTEGIAGFFRGLFPMWYSCVSITIVTYTGVYAYANFNRVNPVNLRLVAAAVGAIANSFFYPLKLTARLMAVSGARLVATRPPRMPTFAQWRDLHKYLLVHGEGKRGSSMLWRKISVKAAPKTDVITKRGGTAYRTQAWRGDEWATRHMTSFLMGSNHGARFSF